MRQTKAIFLFVIVIVIVTIAIVSTLNGSKNIGYFFDDPIAQAKSDIRVLESSLQLYQLDNARLPTNDQGFDALINKPSDGSAPNWSDIGYMLKVPKDPWGNNYRYRNPGVHGEFDVFSLGADGVVGGHGEAADIGNWNLDS